MGVFKSPHTAGIGIVLCLVVFYLASTAKVFGKVINKFFPCEQKLGNSLPCFAQYDIAIMGIAGIIGLVFLFLLVLNLYKRAIEHV